MNTERRKVFYTVEEAIAHFETGHKTGLFAIRELTPQEADRWEEGVGSYGGAYDVMHHRHLIARSAFGVRNIAQNLHTGFYDYEYFEDGEWRR